MTMILAQSDFFLYMYSVQNSTRSTYQSLTEQPRVLTKTCFNRLCRRNRSKNRKHTCATLDDGSEAS